MREKQASFGREKAANWPVWKPLFGKNGLASPIAQLVKTLPAMQMTPIQFLGQEDPMEKG